ncbi:MAG: CoA-disulfide reductase [Lachnospiraceae bacterium]|nr:CoA-disulfide reductase [Lachnospiraceae bacterium]
MKILIIGGVAGGATAAARIRRLDEKAEIIIIERTGYISYANCGLPYYIGGEIKRRERLTLQTPESFLRRFNVDVRVNQEAISIDAEAHKVSIKNLETGEIYEETYDKLVLSPGAKALKLDVEGADLPGVFSLRTVEDTFKIDDYIKENKVKTATIIGGGFVGLEMAENLTNIGINVNLIQRSSHVMPNLDEDMAAILQNYMREKGIKIYLNRNVTAIKNADGKFMVISEKSNYTNSGIGNENNIYINQERKIGEDNDITNSDIIIVAVGVVPESKLAEEAGLQLGQRGAIVTNEYMQTSDKDIYAVGDVVEVVNSVTGKKVLIPLAGPANKQGRIAADNICGIKSEFRGSIGSSIMKMFDMTVASTGISYKQAVKEGYNCDYVILSSASHATYYPGAENMYLKVIFNICNNNISESANGDTENNTLECVKYSLENNVINGMNNNGKILGAQIVGYSGVDKRIDVLVMAIKAGMTAYDLTELELAYAPPFSSAKDPVNMAGYVMTNILDGLNEQIHWEDIELLKNVEHLNIVDSKNIEPELYINIIDRKNKAVESDANTANNINTDCLSLNKIILLDSRTNGEYEKGHIEGAMHIPLDSLRKRMNEIPQNSKIYVYCQSGLRSYTACRMLKQNGYECYNVAGGYGFYKNIVQNNVMDQEGVGPCGIKIN